MLAMDERNFHCWNYRLWVVEEYLKELAARSSASDAPAKPDLEKIFTERQLPLIERECQMALGLIKKNFSNYSAWHYRGKLLPRVSEKNGLLVNHAYCIPFEEIQGDFAMLKHAFFTDPKDQSPWNHHEWLLQQIAPIQVTGLRLVTPSGAEHLEIEVELSHKVKYFEQLQLTVQDGEGASVEVTVRPKRERAVEIGMSSKWTISLAEGKYSLLHVNIKG
mmetsp:Transcript_10042/g.16905  ORF Transcript_10042/g.16905 Transcript_10042/m.16905 type:complete len:220 (+) Transcript_10042:476-1135(+)